MRLVITAVFAAVITVFIVGQTIQSSDRNALPAAVSMEKLHELGYKNIDTERYLYLVSSVRPRCGYSFLERTAEDYMKDNGWDRVEIVGYFVPDDSTGAHHDPLVVAYRNGKSYLLEPPLSGDPLDPGMYWTKGIGSAWTLLRENARTETYWVKLEK